MDCTKFQIYEVLIKKLYQISKQRNVHEMENIQNHECDDISRPRSGKSLLRKLFKLHIYEVENIKVEKSFKFHVLEVVK